MNINAAFYTSMPFFLNINSKVNMEFELKTSQIYFHKKKLILAPRRGRRKLRTVKLLTEWSFNSIVCKLLFFLMPSSYHAFHYARFRKNGSKKSLYFWVWMSKNGSVLLLWPSSFSKWLWIDAFLICATNKKRSAYVPRVVDVALCLRTSCSGFQFFISAGAIFDPLPQ